MFEATTAPLMRTLSSLAVTLKKVKNLQKQKIERVVLLNTRLFSDMYPLTRQVKIGTDMRKGGLARLTGIEIPKYEGNETSFDELQARIANIIAFY